MAESNLEIWDLWYPKAGATGIPFSRSRIERQEVLLVHAAPLHLTVQVSTGDGQLVARGKDLEATADTPMARLTRTEGTIEREDIWPGQDDIGRLVLLPGGEAGTLISWRHAPDRSEWRWQVEFYNHK